MYQRIVTGDNDTSAIATQACVLTSACIAARKSFRNPSRVLTTKKLGRLIANVTSSSIGTLIAENSNCACHRVSQ